MEATVEIYEDNAKEWRWRVTTDGTVIGKSSEGYSRQAYAVENLKSLPKYCREADIKTASAEEHPLPLEFYQDVGSEWRWRITAQNGRIVHASDQGWEAKTDAVSNVEAMVVAVGAWNGA